MPADQHKVFFEDWGLTGYREAWDRQEALFGQKADKKLLNRNLPAEEQTPIEHHLIFCEHPHVYTLGKSGSADNLLVNDAELKALQAEFYPINRGGDITYHGPGQIVGYPLLDLEQFFTDIHRYLRTLEEAVIRTMADHGLKGERYEGYTGVWLDADDPEKARKICAMGVRCSRWITMHGFAFNINTDLSYFDHIVPCGIDDKKVTSMQQELGSALDISAVKEQLLKHLSTLFDMEISRETRTVHS